MKTNLFGFHTLLEANKTLQRPDKIYGVKKENEGKFFSSNGIYGDLPFNRKVKKDQA